MNSEDFLAVPADSAPGAGNASSAAPAPGSAGELFAPSLPAVPGDVTGPGTNAPGGDAGTPTLAGPGDGTTTQTSSLSAGAIPDGDSSGLPLGPLLGAVAGVIALLAVVLLLVVSRRRRSKNAVTKSTTGELGAEVEAALAAAKDDDKVNLTANSDDFSENGSERKWGDGSSLQQLNEDYMVKITDADGMTVASDNSGALQGQSFLDRMCCAKPTTGDADSVQL